ncbi:MAG: RnfH family protein [Gammaproteobacteria bacterium]|nr:MAG: RnfH family protein [Gammaproteobacteria bacterium]
MIRIEVAYVDAQVEFLREIELPAGATVEDALRESGVREASAEAAAATRVGIWSKIVEPMQPLRDGDRVELYRDLKIDPKEARRLRAAKRT